ncbi:MAG TPA: SURF1 family protein [Bellilinea sp.]|nr:SURF1 family protein [Bellilinea sp.]
MLKRFLTVRWILTTILVIAGVGVLIRLGFWQLDRLEWRRAFNARATSQLNAPELDLNAVQPVDDLYDMEYRSVAVTGRYDFSQEILLRNQVWENRLGYHVLTPLKVTGSDWYVLVDRGWIPFEDAASRSKYQEPGEIRVQGMLRRGQEKPDFGGVADPTLAPGESRLDAWNMVNLPRITEQSNLMLLPGYIIQAPQPGWTALPHRSLPEIEISEGSHQSYAMQWFSFAVILGLGYPFFVRRQLKKQSQIEDSAILDKLIKPQADRGGA